MEMLKNVVVPTGNICIVSGEHGQLEFVSLGDYGKDKNLKADFLGIEREINGVPHGDILPLSEKWVITVSTQYGCSMGCSFCDVPKVGPGKNATINDIVGQVMYGVALHPEIKHTKRLNVHFARMGEPTWNNAVLSATLKLKEIIKDYWGWGFHPVVSTICPENHKELIAFLRMWMLIKNDILEGEAGLQLSINTTDQATRWKTMPKALPLHAIPQIFDGVKVVGRKIALNFALTDAPVDAKMLAKLFDPSRFLCKITPMHETAACKNNNLLTRDGYTQYYPYRETEESLKAAGFDVIVFIPSREEDESRITCGNAILSDGIKVSYLTTDQAAEMREMIRTEEGR